VAETVHKTPSKASSGIQDFKVGSPTEWIDARKDLLVKEKEFTRLRDQVCLLRRELPWERVEKEYIFDGPDGEETIQKLFDGKTQLIVYHFMFAPEWEAGCKSCSFWADNFNGVDIHLKHRDTSFLAISRAPYPKLKAYEQRMGWSFKWVSSFGSDFSFYSGASGGRGLRKLQAVETVGDRYRRDQCVLQKRERRRVPYLHLLLARGRYDEWRVPLPGPHTGLDTPPRRIQGLNAPYALIAYLHPTEIDHGQNTNCLRGKKSRCSFA
jgi:Bacterial protein of unknown function (DUF899)